MAVALALLAIAAPFATARPVADLQVATKGLQTPLTRGTLHTFSLVVANHDAADTARNVQVTHVLPDGLSFVSASPRCDERVNTVTCTVAALRAGASRSFTVTVRAAESLHRCVRHSTTLTSDTADAYAPDNTHAATICPAA